ncbi:hypothetical protein [Mesorhizobium japonicum]|nr:hypothetical protein [Mesorhizobium japonicum]
MGSTGELVGQAGRPDSEGGPHRISDAMSDQQKAREETLAIAGAVVARDGNLDGFSDSELADLVNGFSRWPDEQKTREARLIPSDNRAIPYGWGAPSLAEGAIVACALVVREPNEADGKRTLRADRNSRQHGPRRRRDVHGRTTPTLPKVRL